MNDKRKPTFIDSRRRGFLQGVAVTGGGVTLTAKGLLGSEPAAASDALPDETAESKGYELTAHIQRYYDINRN